MAKADIVVVGSSNTDMAIKLQRLPKVGETLLGGEFMTAPGGKGANQAVAAARAGGRVSMVCRVGLDSLGDKAIAGFVEDGVDVTHVTRDRKAASGVALILVAKNGENSIAVASGANDSLSPADIRKARALIMHAKVLVTQLETPLSTVAEAAKLATKAGSLVVLNPAPARPLSDNLLRLVSIITPNETETELLTGIKLSSLDAARKAASKLRRRGVRNVVLTLGAQGAFVDGEGGARLVPGFKVKAIDTTGAGDVFNGALAVALTEGQALEQAVRFANAAAAISVTRFGTQRSAPTRREIEKLLRGSAIPA
jgi:ribokinase